LHANPGRGPRNLEYLCLDNLEDLVFILDDERRYVAIWGRLMQHFGMTPALCLGKTTEEVLGESASIADTEYQGRAIAGETVRYEVRERHDGDVERWFQTRLSPISSMGDRVDYVLGVTSETTELHARERQLERTMHGIIRTLGSVVEARDPYTAGHEEGVATLAVLLAEEMRLPAEEIDTIRTAALVHDIGKLHVPAEILSKPYRLSDNEYSIVKTHAEQSYEILRQIDFGSPVAEIVLQHHERIDGSGYPKGLVGDEILPAARIIAVADVLEAVASPRPYRPALGMEAAVAEIAEHPEAYDRAASEACARLWKRGKLRLDQVDYVEGDPRDL
jgi:putative nucleotidyltransferase with HDIG domain/PAS domain S-box-containing protein